MACLSRRTSKFISIQKFVAFFFSANLLFCFAFAFYSKIGRTFQLNASSVESVKDADYVAHEGPTSTQTFLRDDLKAPAYRRLTKDWDDIFLVVTLQ